MAARTTEQVKSELESERARLGDAVDTLHRQARSARRKLPFVIVGLAAAGALAGIVRRRVFEQDAPETGRRARRSRFDRD